jgi:predicted permease
MTDLFGRLGPGVTIEQARAELTTVHDAMMRAHPNAYSSNGAIQLRVSRLRDQIASPARTILLVLLAAAAIVFVIACSNVANLILARSVRRQGELAIRAALGAGAGALRRTLLAESLVLCGAGAALGLALADPFESLIARFAARFSIRALDVSVDPAMLWVGVGLAVAAAVLLAFVPRLPTTSNATGPSLVGTSVRLTPSTNRRLRVFATIQIAFSFVLLAVAGMLMSALVHLETARTGLDLPHIVAFDVPPSAAGVGVGDPNVLNLYDEVARRVRRLPGVQAAAIGMFVPWRDNGLFGAALAYRGEGQAHVPGQDDPRAQMRVVAPGFFATIGLPILEGRDFNDGDHAGDALVAVISETVARRAFPQLGTHGAVNRQLIWREGVNNKDLSSRVVGVVPDFDDENVIAGPAPRLYLALPQVGVPNRVFVRAAGDPHTIVPDVTRVIRALLPDQAVARPATLEEVRDSVLSPERLNAFVVTGFAGIALLIAVVGVSGVLAFSVSARTREFGIRLAIGSQPRKLVAGVVSEGVAIAVIGIAAGAGAGALATRAAAGLVANVGTPGALPAIAAAAVLIAAAALAALWPALRASRVDVLQALRSE